MSAAPEVVLPEEPPSPKKKKKKKKKKKAAVEPEPEPEHEPEADHEPEAEHEPEPEPEPDASTRALLFLQRSAAIRERTFGAADPSVGEMCNTIGLRLKERGQLDEALGYFERAAAAREASLGGADADTLLTRGNLAEALLERRGKEDLGRALEILGDVAAKQTAALGEGSPFTLYTRANAALAKALQPTSVPADFASASSELEAVRSAQARAHSGGELSRYALKSAAHLEAVAKARAAWVSKHPVYEQDALLAMDAKKLMKLTCKVLRKKEKQVTMMCAGKRPTPDELALLIINAPSQLETKELLAAKEAQPAAAPSEAPAVEPRPPDSAPPPSTPRREANWSAEWRAHHSATPPLALGSPERQRVERPESPGPDAQGTPDVFVLPSRSEQRAREAARRRISVSVLQCRNLPKADLIGANDVYVAAALDDGAESRTTTIDCGGAAPIWCGGGGETLVLEPVALDSAIGAVAGGMPLPKRIGLKVFDEDKGSKDDVLGELSIPILELNPDFGSDWCVDSWHPLSGGPAKAKSKKAKKKAQPVEDIVLPTHACLHVSLLECRGLKKMDGRFGSNDVFVTLDLDGDVKKSSTVDDGGAAPAWRGGSGEPFYFEKADLPHQLRVEAFDEDVGSADDSIGSHTITLAEIGPEDHTDHAQWLDWSTCKWYGLSDAKGKATGEVRLFMRWGVPPPLSAPREWRLQIKVLECADLKKMDLTGQNDVYVKVHADGAEGKNRTSTVEGGGAAPVWKGEDGDGESVTFRLRAAPASLGFEVYDEDQGSADDLIGTHCLEIGTQVGAGKWNTEGWLELTSSKEGKCTGRVRVSVSWWHAGALSPVSAIPEPIAAAGQQGQIRLAVRWGLPAVDIAQPEDVPLRWELRVTIMECSDLKKMDRLGKNDVFTSVHVEGAPVLRTSTIHDGGAAPRWDASAGEGLLVLALAGAPAALGVQVWDEDVGSADDLIGTAVVPLAVLQEPNGVAKSWSAQAAWHDLLDGKGAGTGRVRLGLEWCASASATSEATRPWTPEQAHFWATDTNRLLDEVDSFLLEPNPEPEPEPEAEAEAEPQEEFGEADQEQAAVKIQAAARGRATRRQRVYAADDERHKLEEEQRAAAARRIQACVASLRLFALAIAACSDPCVAPAHSWEIRQRPAQHEPSARAEGGGRVRVAHPRRCDRRGSLRALCVCPSGGSAAGRRAT